MIIRRTRVGLEMRAQVDRESLASLRGINPRRTSAIAWMLSMTLAGLGGVLIAPLFQLNDPTFLFVVFASLAAVALAGLRSIPLAFAAGLALGVTQNLVAGYKHDVLPNFLSSLSGLEAAVPYVILLGVLFLVGRDRGRAAGSVSDEKPAPDHRIGLPSWRRKLPWAIFTARARGLHARRVRLAPQPVLRAREHPGPGPRAWRSCSCRSSSSPASAGW